VRAGATEPEDVLSAVLDQALGGDDRKLGEILVAKGGARQADVDGALEAQHDGRRSVADSSIRVDVDLLDALMTLVGELVLTRNQIVQHASTRADTDLLRSSQRLNLIASELQEGVMKTRMQPIDSIWSKVPRVVRDLSHTCGKQVRVEMEGKETELDRTILESTKDPLTHLVRNAVDHALETPAERAAAGKPTEGLLLLRAYHEGGQVNIEITDDGKGIDPAVIGAKALEKGLVSAEQLARMTPREIVDLIFLAGFSTAAAVTNVSGRGVGMDVVKTNIEKIGGTIDVQSHVGRGTTFRIKIPLTLAIIPALTVTCAGDRYAIPQVSLLELVRLEGEAVTRTSSRSTGAGLPPARQPAAAGPPRPRAGGRPGELDRTATRCSSWSCRPRTGSSAWSSTTSSTPRRSSSSRSASSSRASRPSPARRSSVTAPSRSSSTCCRSRSSPTSSSPVVSGASATAPPAATPRSARSSPCSSSASARAGAWASRWRW
jgi:two-component system chemotaxis sensor kinase CheA